MYFRATFASYTTQWTIVLILFFCTLCALLWYTNVQVLQYASQPIGTQIEESRVAIVFGGGMQSDGSQTIMQQDRVLVAGDLFLNNIVDMIIVSGDDGANRFDETSAMYDQLIAYGIPETAIQIDPHGYRTYESCWRAARVFDIDTAIVVSHAFHLPRIRYLCESFGIRTIGVSADIGEYNGAWLASGPREILARMKAWWQVEITKPLPRVTY
jgi:SanA protein